uniref:PABPN1 like, cytoplasmic n=1 Tax=Junco hyemalis TaxID=40217 RepID=A0A8C5IM60_JUNHY
MQELEAIKAKLREIEKEDERLKELQLEADNHLFMSSEAALFPLTTKEKMEADQRSIYVGNVDYGGTAEELESHFNSCGQINRVTILCDKFSGHPKGYAYIEFEEQSSVKAAVELDESVFRGRVIKVRAGGAPRGLFPPFPALPAWCGPNPSSSSPSLPCRCCPRGPTCPASAARTAAATGAASTPGAGWAAGGAPMGSSPGSGGEPTGVGQGCCLGIFHTRRGWTAW